jgi:hypothetical protein
MRNTKDLLGGSGIKDIGTQQRVSAPGAPASIESSAWAARHGMDEATVMAAPVPSPPDNSV